MPRTVSVISALVLASATPTAATTAPRGTSPITETQARPFARAVNLRPADVRGTRAIGEEHSVTGVKRTAIKMAHCDHGVSPKRRVALIASPEFRAVHEAQLSAGSEVEIMPTARLAAQKLSAEVSSLGRACFQLIREELFRHSQGAVIIGVEGHITSWLVTWLQPPLPSVPSYARRLVDTVARRGGTVPVVIDTLGFLSGPARISLTVWRVGEPPSASTERRLLSLLYSRAKAHKL